MSDRVWHSDVSEYDDHKRRWHERAEALGHVLQRTEYDDRLIDDFAGTDFGFHNGPRCVRCGWTTCMHCDWELEKIPPCEGEEDVAL